MKTPYKGSRFHPSFRPHTSVHLQYSIHRSLTHGNRIGLWRGRDGGGLGDAGVDLARADVERSAFLDGARGGGP